MKRNFIAIFTIVCPKCNIRQTGIIRIYNTKNQEPIEIDENVPPGEDEIFAIRCSWSQCKHLIAGEELNIATQKAIKSPMDFKS